MRHSDASTRLIVTDGFRGIVSKDWAGVFKELYLEHEDVVDDIPSNLHDTDSDMRCGSTK